MNEHTRKSNAVLITSIIAVALVLLAGIGAYVYTNDRQLQQEQDIADKQLKLEQDELNQKRDSERKDAMNRIILGQ